MERLIMVLMLATVGSAAIHAFGVWHGLGLMCAVWLLMPYPVRP